LLTGGLPRDRRGKAFMAALSRRSGALVLAKSLVLAAVAPDIRVAGPLKGKAILCQIR